MSRTWLVSAVLVLLLNVQPLIAAEKKAVVDVDGNEIKAGQPYYVVSAIWGAGGGGLSPAIMNGTSTHYVMQHQRDMDYGRPVIFTPVSSSHDRRTIYESTGLKVRFVGEGVGVDEVWMLADANEDGTRYVKVDFIPPLLSFPPLKNFQIEKVEELPYTYKLVYCDGAKTSCRDLGITVEDGKRWLALSERPFVFVLIHEHLKQMI